MRESTGNKEKFVRLVAIAGLTWLCSLDSEEDPIPEDPIELMAAVKGNLPVWEFISFLIYGGLFALYQTKRQWRRELD